MATQAGKKVIHHSLGNGEFDFYYHMTKPVVCARTILTPENTVNEMKRVMTEAVRTRRPVYIAIPKDCAEMKIIGSPTPEDIQLQSDPDRLAAAVDDILSRIHDNERGVFLPGIMAYRIGVGNVLQRLIEKTGFGFATMFHDKSVLDETHPLYVGMYDGQLMNQKVREHVENADLVINVGALWGDFNTGMFTSNLDGHKTIDIYLDHTQVGFAVYEQVYMRDLLTALADRVHGSDPQYTLPAENLGDPLGLPDEDISPGYFYPRMEQFFQPHDIIICETGTVSMGMGFAKLPANTVFCNQTLWGAIGWATPAAFGAAIAEPDRRIVLMTGEGAHQMTATEIGTFQRYNLKPIIITLNNNGYTIERLLCRYPEYEYNDIPQWHYACLPKVMGCDNWLTIRATTNQELDAALKKINASDQPAYLEVMMDQMQAPPLALKIGQALGMKK